MRRNPRAALSPGGFFSAIGRVLVFAGVFVVFTAVAAMLASAFGSWPAGAAGLAADGAITLLGALGAGWLMLWLVEGAPPARLGFAVGPRVGRDAGRGALLGVTMLAVVLVPLLLAGWIGYRAEAGTLGGVLAAWARGLELLALPAAAEEALFRGYVFQALVVGIGPVAATALSSAAFAVAHVWNPNVGAIGLANIFLAGVLLSIAYLRTGSLWFASGVHVGWNWAMASVAELPVSGLTFLHTPLYGPVERGPAWVTGGTFGPEGGAMGTVAFLVGLALLLRVRRTAEPVPAWRAPRRNAGEDVTRTEVERG